MELSLEGREVEILEIQGEFGEGAYAISAMFVDTGDELTDKELDIFNDHNAAEIYDQYYQNMIDQAERAADCAMDR